MRKFIFRSTNRLIFLTAILVYISTGCEKPTIVKSPSSDPVAVFDELYNFMDTHYSMFSVKGVDWKQVYIEYRPQVKTEMSEADLFKLLSSMLYTLKDGHVNLMTRKDTSAYTNFYKAYPTNFNYANIVNRYLGNDFKTSGPIIYKVVNNLGYIYYKSFSRPVTDDDLNRIFTDVAPTKGLIVDVRNNFGGQSINTEKLFSRFISEKLLVKYEVTKRGVGHDDFFEPVPFYASPSLSPYKKNVILLANRLCFSTCNDFVLYMSLLPNVKIVGDQTGGGGGNPFNYVLANGWKIQYSATRTLSPDKSNIESGILPDYPIEISNADEVAGKDPILEKAFELLR